MKTVIVKNDDDDIRLDKWFRRYFEDFSMGELNKMLRKKNIKLNGKRAEGGSHIFENDEIAYPESFDRFLKTNTEKPDISEKDALWLQSLVLYKSRDIIAINKPSGLAVQGGSKQKRHLDAMLDALSFGAEKPKLVHRLDKDTSGVLLLARSARAANWLARTFEDRGMKKTYLAVVAKKMKAGYGEIKAPLSKVMQNGTELVDVDKENGLPALTFYTVLATSKDASLLKLEPKTGRMHQLRVHCKYIAHPIIGDKKYGENINKKQKLLLHACSIEIPDGNQIIKISAPLPDYMLESIKRFNLDVGEIK